MSSIPLSSDTIALMKSAQKYLYQFGCPILMFIGTVSCIINLIVFTQKILRKNPCSIYFIAYNVANFIYIYSSLLALTLSVGYSIDASVYNLIICRLRLYTVTLFNILSPFYIILASIDRILITSSNALTRQRSTRRLAYLCIIIGTLFWALFHIHALIASSITQLAPNTFLCYFQPGVHLIFVSYYALIKETSSLSLMIICGLWSIKNIRSMGRVRMIVNTSVSKTTTGGSIQSNSSKDQQLMFMLLMDIIIYASFSFVFVIYLMYQQTTQNYIKNAERIQIETCIRNICLFSAGIPFCTSCYANLIVSKTFRSEAKKAISWKRILCIN
ncbi:unnamed protein product [Rotaria sordida]|uniref:G-protein coupled receptors family 1 profile domain-containing protein n=1 Tax=Rotaria sordida TaxID=392033 RepID=A0A814SZ73_9BILA|nr:unnamed protein product [Rotaria sordida]CAF1392755.1 unnamed protein product [Rotaria sordida]